MSPPWLCLHKCRLNVMSRMHEGKVMRMISHSKMTLKFDNKHRYYHHWTEPGIQCGYQRIPYYTSRYGWIKPCSPYSNWLMLTLPSTVYRNRIHWDSVRSLHVVLDTVLWGQCKQQGYASTCLWPHMPIGGRALVLGYASDVFSICLGGYKWTTSEELHELCLHSHSGICYQTTCSGQFRKSFSRNKIGAFLKCIIISENLRKFQYCANFEYPKK